MYVANYYEAPIKYAHSFVKLNKIISLQAIVNSFRNFCYEIENYDVILCNMHYNGLLLSLK